MKAAESFNILTQYFDFCIIIKSCTMYNVVYILWLNMLY